VFLQSGERRIRLRERAPAERRSEGRLGVPRLRHVGLGATHSTRGRRRRRASTRNSRPVRNFAGLALDVTAGQVPQARLDDMVHRILRAMYAAGLFAYPEHLTPIDTATDQAIAQEAEEQGAVLLKDAGGLLRAERGGRQIDRRDRIRTRMWGCFPAGDRRRFTPSGGAAPLPKVTPKTPRLGAGGLGSIVPAHAIRANGPRRNRKFRFGTSAASAGCAGGQIAGGHRIRQPVGQRGDGSGEPELHGPH